MPSTYATKRAAERAEDDARVALTDAAMRGATVAGFWREWTSDPLAARASESTNVQNCERTKGFALAYGDRPVRTIGAAEVSEWLKGGRNRGTVDALSAMFNDARKPQASMLIDVNPFAALGLKKSSGRKNLQGNDPH